MQPNTTRPDEWLSYGLAFVGGYGDAASFILAKSFTGHITGNMVLAAITVAARDWRGTLTNLSAVLFFLIGILVSVLVARLLAAWPSWPMLSTAMGIEVILIAAAYLALTSRAPAGVELFVMCMSLALGLQNGAFRRSGGISVHTTYLTGLITGLITTEAERYGFRSPFRPATSPDPKSRLLYGIWAAFFSGAVTGAAMVFRFKDLGILGAALILSAIIARKLVREPRVRSAG